MSEILQQQDSRRKFTVGYVDGTFDLLHVGHLIMLEECREHCDYLIVALCVNPNVMQKEKKRPIETIFERFMRLRAVKFVDEIIVYESSEDKKALLELLYAQYSNNLIRFADEKYKNSHKNEIDLPIRVYFNSRKHNYSSTNLRNRIKIN